MCIILSCADLKPLLTPEMVTELVMVSMKNLPSHQPRTFRSSYTPIAAAGTDAQVNCYTTYSSKSSYYSRTSLIRTSWDQRLFR